MKKDGIIDLFNCIYRFRDKKGEIIYIGKAENLEGRMCNHKHLPEECYKETVSVEYVCFETKDIMDLAERYYIPKVKPKYNDKMKKRDFGGFSIKELDNLKWKKYKKGLSQNRSSLESDKRIVEIFSGRIFNTTSEASYELKTTLSSINLNCNNKSRRCYNDKNEILCFMKFEDYKRASIEEIENKKELAINIGKKTTVKPIRKIRCITNGQVFEESYIDFYCMEYQMSKARLKANLNGRKEDVIAIIGGECHWLKFEYVA